jgi:hypothetical protein
MTDDQKAKLFFNHKRAYEAALAVKKKADADFKNACKLAKSEGTKIEDIRLAIELESDEGDTALKARLEAQLRIARWMGSPVGTQADMFGGVDRTPSVDMAYDDGKRDGLAGRDFSPKYAPGTAQYGRYREGHADGQAVNLSGIKPIDPDDILARAPQPDHLAEEPDSDEDRGARDFRAGIGGVVPADLAGDKARAEAWLAGWDRESKRSFDDATADSPSRRRQPDPFDGAPAAA